jgi:hypothetical protein
MKKKINRFISVSIAIIGTICMTLPYWGSFIFKTRLPELLVNVRSVVPEGMARQEVLVVPILSGAWYHATCYHGLQDLYIFGDKTWSNTQTIVVTYTKSDNVSGVFMMQTYNLLMYGECVSKDTLNMLRSTRPLLSKLLAK